MQRTVIVIAVVVVLVGFLGFIVLPWLQKALFGETNEVSVTILSACRDDDVDSGIKGQSVSRIVAEVEITFKYGDEPDSIQDLVVKDDDNNLVEVNWGAAEPEKRPLESKNKTSLIIRQAFFPTDFRQGKLWQKDKYLCYFRMPAVSTMCPRVGGPQ
ncbi:MAG TPA: hypothetical protein VKX17_15070 [Planctomycetota bacterium]|nr:hypothetical protein [Planctomycetota bacterium]